MLVGGRTSYADSVSGLTSPTAAEAVEGEILEPKLVFPNPAATQVHFDDASAAASSQPHHILPLEAGPVAAGASLPEIAPADDEEAAEVNSSCAAEMVDPSEAVPVYTAVVARPL